MIVEKISFFLFFQQVKTFSVTCSHQEDCTGQDSYLKCRADCHSNPSKRKEEFDFPCFLSSFFSFLLSFFHVLNGVLDDYLDQ